LAESNNKKVVLEAKLEGNLYPTREILQGIVASKSKELAGYNKDQDDLDNTRAEEKEEFDEKVREHEEATAVISEVRRLFTENLSAEGEAVFLQRGKVLNPKAKLNYNALSLIQKHLTTSAKKASKFVHRKAYAKIFKVLATISSKAQQLADQGALGRIIDLIDELLGKIQDSLDLERSAEDSRIAAYNKARKLLNITIGITQTALANAQTALASVEDQIELAETSLENTEQRIENKTGERKDRWEQCEQAAQDYADARSQRDSDRQTISDTLGIVNSQLRTLREQLALRIQAGDSFDY
jgi:chromosome segregation ATPase